MCKSLQQGKSEKDKWFLVVCSCTIFDVAMSSSLQTLTPMEQRCSNVQIYCIQGFGGLSLFRNI